MACAGEVLILLFMIFSCQTKQVKDGEYLYEDLFNHLSNHKMILFVFVFVM